MCKVSMVDVENAVKDFAAQIIKEGGDIDLSQVKYHALQRAIKAEYASGQTGTVYEVLSDLHDTIGLDEYGLLIDFPCDLRC